MLFPFAGRCRGPKKPYSAAGFSIIPHDRPAELPRPRFPRENREIPSRAGPGYPDGADRITRTKKESGKMAKDLPKENDTQPNIPKIFLIVLAVYLLLTVGFYFLAGDQLLYRVSRGDLEMRPADAAAVELSRDVTAEQVFSAKIQRLQSVSVRWGAYYRANSGTVTIELLRTDDMSVLMSGSFDVSPIVEGSVLTVCSDTPIEDVYGLPLILRLSSDCEPGSAVTPLIDSQAEEDGFSLSINGEPSPGMLCFAAEGTDYIWTGLHYWLFVGLLGALLAAFMLIIWLRYRSGRRSFVVNSLIAVKKYRFLIRQLVGRDFKTKYKRSVLGVFWSFLNPLLMMLVQYFVFSTIFRNDIPHFASYLIIGTVMFNFFSESCGMTLTSILGNSNLITKVYMPKYIYPLTRTMSSMVNLAISLVPMLIVCLASGVHFQKSAVLALFFFACVVIFSLGLGMLLATSMVFFRDTQFLWNVLSMMWMYATPIFYPESILPDNLKFVLTVNPLYHFLKNARSCLLDGLSPEPIVYIQCLLIALAMLAVGAAVFYRKQDKFVLYM
jgi:ABC-2 type transport system permease protein